MGPSQGKTFHILVVDDDRIGAHVLQEVMQNLKRPYRLHFAWDGDGALDFLNRRGPYQAEPRPDLILLDVNMVRVDGLEVLATIKRDPELCVIPVIMLSTSASPRDVWMSYQSHANAYVQKPTSLDRSEKFVQVIESFWMDFAILPAVSERPAHLPHLSDSSGLGKSRSEPRSGAGGLGNSIAFPLAEARSHATETNESLFSTTLSNSGCREHRRLLQELGMAVRELIELHEQQFLAILEGDSECHRFDLLIHMANERKQSGKYAYLRHVESHGCLNADAIDQSRT